MPTVVVDSSPFTGAREVMLRFFQWHVEMQWGSMPMNNYLGIMNSLCLGDGGLVLYRVPIYMARHVRGTKSGTVTLSGAHASGATSITVTGGSGAFTTGDWIYLDQSTNVPRAHIVVLSEMAGVIQIRPGLRVAHANGTVVKHFANGEIFDTMEIATPEPMMAEIEVMPKPRYSYPFSVEFVSALRLSP